MAAATDRNHVTSLVGRLVSSVTREAACELGRVYEYQLALLGDGQAGAMLAAHAARCVIDYVICGGRYLEQETIVMGAVKGQARPSPSATGPMPVVSVIVGERELKWRLDEILKKPGLRLETYLCSDDYQVCHFRACISDLSQATGARHAQRKNCAKPLQIGTWLPLAAYKKSPVPYPIVPSPTTYYLPFSHNTSVTDDDKQRRSTIVQKTPTA